MTASTNNSVHAADIHIHIGLEKTGSTSIQKYCSHHRKRLSKKGILYPSSLGQKNHTKLALVLPDYAKIDFLRRQSGITTLQQIRTASQRLQRALRTEIIDCQPHTVIVSNEHLSSRLTTPEEIQRLRTFLLPFARTLTIYVYLRPQEQLILSRYSTYIRCGGTKNFAEYLQLPRPVFLNYASLLNQWSAVFDDNNIQVRLFNRDALEEGNVVTDFIKQLPLADPDLPQADAGSSNISLPIATLEKLRKLYLRLPALQRPAMAKVRRFIIRWLDSSGETLALDRASADIIRRRFDAENRAVAQRFFQRDILFTAHTTEPAANQPQPVTE